MASTVPIAGPAARRRRRVGLIPVPLAERPLGLLRGELGEERLAQLDAAAASASAVLGDRTIWFVNSTARGGGVAEMSRTLLPYWRGAGLDVRWLVLEAPPAYFRLTKRLHHLLHGDDVARPGLGDRDLYDRVARTLSARAAGLVRPGDLVVAQDPQAAGLVPALARAGATVVWRCHVGADEPGEPVDAAWSFLAPYVEPAAAYVFTRRTFVPAFLDPARVRILTPAIDPCSEKNRPLELAAADAVLARAGVLGAIDPARERVVLSLARWDPLKDPIGLLHGFAFHVADPRARLVLAGPAVGAVADDPEGRAVLARARAARARLPASARRRIRLAVLPMDDLDENARIVNALQRRAAVIVKKSLHEGFGLGVTEGLWKARPVLATRVGGHQDQITDGETGVLLDDPRDLAAFGAAIDALLADEARGLTLGLAGRERVRERYLADTHFLAWMRMLGGLG